PSQLYTLSLHDALPISVRNLNCELHLIQSESCVGRAARPPAVIGIEFYPIRAFANLFAHDARQAVDAVSFFRPLRHIPFGRVTRSEEHTSELQSPCISY